MTVSSDRAFVIDDLRAELNGDRSLMYLAVDSSDNTVCTLDYLDLKLFIELLARFRDMMTVAPKVIQ